MPQPPSHPATQPKEAQALARHSTITLTMDCYTHLGIVDLHSALSRLPEFASSIASAEPARAKRLAMANDA